MSITTEEITHLGRLSRIALTPAETAAFSAEIEAIVQYVSTVTTITGDDAQVGVALGARINVLRSDVVTTENSEYTEALLTAMPHRQGNYMAVKKILTGSN
jgi:aspartyl-tRNA(Asn)/glutamyl-tRNA(Gln) amidotransferase subunit C